MERIYENGQVIDASVLDITPEQIAGSFYCGLQRVAALGFTLSYPTIIGVPHSLLRAYKDALALGLELNTYSWDGLDTVKEILENPEAFAAAAGGGGGAAATSGGGAAAAPKEDTPEPSSSAAAPGGGMFGGDSSSDDDSDSS